MTQLVYPFTLVPGQPENVNQLNSNLGAVQSVLNGNVGADNIADGSVDFAELTTGVQNGLADNLQPGVVGANDGKVTFASSVGVSVAAGSAWVANASGFLRRVSWNASALTVPMPATGLGRLDQVVVDSTGTLRVVSGSEVASVTLDTRTGAASLPTGVLRLGDVLTAQGSGGIVNSTFLRDRRPWARGALAAGVGSGGGDTTTVSGSYVATGSGLSDFRIECSGAPLELVFTGSGGNNTAGSGSIFGIVDLTSGSIEVGRQEVVAATGGHWYPFTVRLIISPTPGSRLYSPRFAVVSGTAVLKNGNGQVAPKFQIRELLAPNANNGLG
jgi:hypothetical protein